MPFKDLFGAQLARLQKSGIPYTVHKEKEAFTQIDDHASAPACPLEKGVGGACRYSKAPGDERYCFECAEVVTLDMKGKK